MMENANNNEFIGYEYKEVTIPRSMDSVYTDGYANFGWQPEGSSPTPSVGKIVMKYKRNRKLRNNGGNHEAATKIRRLAPKRYRRWNAPKSLRRPLSPIRWDLSARRFSRGRHSPTLPR